MIDQIHVRRRERTVLSQASLHADSPGLLFLVGPGGAGKSSLLAALAGHTGDDAPTLTGTVEFDGCSLAALDSRPTWVPQHAQLVGNVPMGPQIMQLSEASPARAAALLAKAGVDMPRAAMNLPAAGIDASRRRLLAVLAGLQRESSIYLVDEPTANMEPAHVEIVRQRLSDLARVASVVVATHNRQDCLALCGRTALLAGGTVQECLPTRQFFSSPSSDAGRTYVETGNCGVQVSPRRSGDQHGIWWLVGGLLAGMARPGIGGDVDRQCRHLIERGVGLLVCLEERAYRADAIRAHGIEHHHIPVPDMAPPSFSQAVDLCRLAESAIGENRGIVLHCRGGLGRTGTGLAAILIWFGDSADDAVAKVRAVQPLAIQSAAQTRFLTEFADRIRGWQ